MDHQWRPRPMQGNICPVCGISHFPFCPPPTHSFSPNPRFTQYSPGFDPFRAPPMMPPHPLWRGPNDGFNDQRYWYGTGVDPYGQLPPQPHPEYYASVTSNNGGSNGFVGDGERNYKRMRVGDVSSSEDYQSSALVASEAERRLKLIREHGNMVAAGTLSAGNSGYNHEIGRFSTDAEISWSGMSGLKGGIPRNNRGPHEANLRPDGTQDRRGSRNLPGLNDPSLNEQRSYSPYPSAPAFNAGCLPFSACSLSPASADPSTPMSSTSPRTPSSLFPVGLSSSRMPPSYPSAPYNYSTPANPHIHLSNAPNGFIPEYVVENQSLPPQNPALQERKVIDASHIFKTPHRAGRPDHFVIILRGLPGSGKSYLAKILRDLEVENGGSPPRIYSMDDYFMTEVEKVEELDTSNSSSGVRGKRSTTKKVMEYCYEPEMEEAYRASMLKAYKRTLEEGGFTFVIVDDRNLRVADFAQFWAIGKKSGYEVYILEATYKDPEGCAARNLHGFTLVDIHKMVERWEETPALYLQLNVKSLLHGDDLKGSGIQEVVMEMEEENDEGLPTTEGKKSENSVEPSLACDEPLGNLPEGLVRWDTDAETFTEVVRELGMSKWSDEPEGQERPEYTNLPLSVLSGLAEAYTGKNGKSVRWGDEVGDTGFSIAAAKKSSMSSLVIGPGAGYNLKSNPLPTYGISGNSSKSVQRRRQSVFQERLRAETESFKAVFDKRRHRIGGFEPDEE